MNFYPNVSTGVVDITSYWYISYEIKLLKIQILYYRFQNDIPRLQMTYWIPLKCLKSTGKRIVLVVVAKRGIVP